MKRIFTIVGLGLLVSACTVSFNFTGTSAPSNLETLYIEVFLNEAEIVVPYLAQSMTEALQDRFLSQSRLSLGTSGSSDVELSGSVTRYTMVPVAISGNDQAAQNRLTIGVRVNFVNNQDNNDSWEQTFSSYVDFDAEEDFAAVEEDKIDEVLDQLTQDIFSKSIGKW